MALEDLSLRVRQSTGPIDISGVFEDADGDTLSYSASSNNTSVANASIAGSQMTVVAGDTRGTAEITVTADDDNGGTASDMFMVTVAEDYTLTADPMRDPDMPSTYVVVELGEYTAKFDLAVAGSEDDVTVTVTASEPDDGGITVTDSDGLIGAGFVDEEETDLEGSLTVKATDQGSRAFEIEGECITPGAMVTIVVEDKDLDEVAKGYILCKEPVIIVPDDDEFRSDVMTVVSYNDWDHWEMYETVSDGFLIDDTDNNVEHMVNQDEDNNMMGILVRDEPVVDSYQLAISPKETLTLKAGEDPNRLTKAEAEAGQHTIEVMTGAVNVQLTVTSVMEGPAYIRFLDSDMMPFGTDVDEEPMWRGADVVGLDSQGRLALNKMPELSKAEALAYDQYRVVIPGAADSYAYLDGIGGDYYQGAFRFFNPCPSEGHHFYVEVYESEGKYLKTTEKVMCVLSPRPGPAGLTFKIDSQKAGEGVLEYKPARNAVSHDVLLIDAENRNIVTTVADAESPVMFDNLNNGWTYHIVVIAEGVNGQYTADGVRNYHVEWLGEDDVPLSTAPSDAPDDTHPLCQTGYADVMMLLAKCDTEPVQPPELTAPSNVMATVDDSDPGAISVTVTWTDGANADGHEVGLVDLSNYSVRDHRVTDGAMSHTFTSVASGRYMAIVVSTMDAEFLYAVDIVVVP